jgi:hypothetical protein
MVSELLNDPAINSAFRTIHHVIAFRYEKLDVSECVSLDDVNEDPGGSESCQHGGWARPSLGRPGSALIAGGIGMMLPQTTRLAASFSRLMIFLWVVVLDIP